VFWEILRRGGGRGGWLTWATAEVAWQCFSGYGPKKFENISNKETHDFIKQQYKIKVCYIN